MSIVNENDFFFLSAKDMSLYTDKTYLNMSTSQILLYTEAPILGSIFGEENPENAFFVIEAQTSLSNQINFWVEKK